MPTIKRIIMLVACISLLPAYAAADIVNDDATPLSNSGFKFSPIAHGYTAELLGFIAGYANLNKTQQASTYMEVVQGLAHDKNDTKLKIKQAAILAMPNSSLRDTTLAQQHLDALLADTSLSESNTNLVKLIHVFTLNYNKQQKAARTTAKKTEILKQKNKALSQKLNDIKNIEKTMIERNAKANSQ